ncbi:MAG: phenylacetate--CoA ligase family protein [Bacteroidales bacterium]|nr:phenylacetate--CoA ligase family protein [Bacteroidales bacterium]
MKNLYNLFLEKILLPIGDLINGSSVSKELKRWRKICTLSETEINELSERNLKNTLAFAIKNVPYYANLNMEYHDNPYQWLKKFPIMDKSKIRIFQDKLLSVPKDNLIPCKSSGSSGIQTTTYQNKKEQSANRAMQMLWWEWAGYYPGKKIVQTGINAKRGLLKSIKDIFFRTEYVSAFAHKEDEVIALLKKLQTKHGYHFGGYASSLNVFAEIAIKKEIKDVKFDAAISWGDKLFEHYKRNIKEAFGCHVFETYGCSEGFLVAAKKDNDYYYIMSPHVVVEIVDDNDIDVPDGEWGLILLTRLDNFSMPLIRYKIGDLGSILPKSEYPEIRDMNFPLLKQIVGRSTDVVKTNSGKYMVVHAFTGIFEHIPEIYQFKVIQRNYDSIEIEYIPGVNFHQDILEKIETKIQNHLSEKFPVTWKKVSQISPSPSGKPRLIESYL